MTPNPNPKEREAMTQVLIKAELLDGPPDEDGNIRVLIPYSEGTNPAHGRVRFVDPGVVIVPVGVTETGAQS
jgi:hypothetical protein